MESNYRSSDHCNEVISRGIELLLDSKTVSTSHSYFCDAVGVTIRDEDKTKIIQYREAAAAVLIRNNLEIGDSLARQLRFGSALEIYTSLVDVANAPSMIQFQVDHNAGTCLARLGRKEEALAFYMKALRISPNNSKTLKNIAILLADMKRYVEAIGAFDEYLCAHPKSYSALCGKAGCLKDLQCYARSIKVAEDAQLLDPNLHRGRCAYDLKEHCSQEILKAETHGLDCSPISHSITKFESAPFATTSYTLGRNDGIDLKKWIASAKQENGTKKIHDDFNLPQFKSYDIFRNESDEIQITQPSPRENLSEKLRPFYVRIPGSDMLINSTPHKQVFN
jgi:tetratricopeptide (TPR) repeat protein